MRRKQIKPNKIQGNFISYKLKKQQYSTSGILNKTHNNYDGSSFVDTRIEKPVKKLTNSI